MSQYSVKMNPFFDDGDLVRNPVSDARHYRWHSRPVTDSGGNSVRPRIEGVALQCTSGAKLSDDILLRPSSPEYEAALADESSRASQSRNQVEDRRWHRQPSDSALILMSATIVPASRKLTHRKVIADIPLQVEYLILHKRVEVLIAGPDRENAACDACLKTTFGPEQKFSRADHLVRSHSHRVECTADITIEV